MIANQKMETKYLNQQHLKRERAEKEIRRGEKVAKAEKEAEKEEKGGRLTET
jgi:hypothetical protein